MNGNSKPTSSDKCNEFMSWYNFNSKILTSSKKASVEFLNRYITLIYVIVISSYIRAVTQLILLMTLYGYMQRVRREDTGTENNQFLIPFAS